MPLNQLNQFSNRALYFGAPIAIFIGVRFLAGGPQSSHASTLPAKLNQGPLPKLLGETPDDAAQKDGQAVALSIQTKLSPFWYDERAELTSFEYTEPEELEPVHVHHATLRLVDYKAKMIGQVTTHRAKHTLSTSRRLREDHKIIRVTHERQTATLQFPVQII